MTKEELKQYRHLAREVAQLSDALLKVENDLVGVRSPFLSGMPRTKRSQDHTGERLDKLSRLQELLRQKIDRRIELQTRIEQALDNLPPREASLMRLHYIEGLTWEQVAEAICYEWAQTCRIHCGALEMLRAAEVMR